MKPLAAAFCALAGFGAAGASAADVTVYGVLNTGVTYSSVEKTPGDADRSLVMDSGNYLGSRFGLKGEEELVPGTRVGFVLENGFSGDTGALSDDGRMFGREASLWLSDETLGTVRFGRLTVMTGSTGTSGLMAGRFSAMSTGWGVVWGHNAVFAGKFGRMDNMLMYSTPKWGGLQLHAQYSSGIDQKTEEDGEENARTTTRYMGLGAQYFAGPLSVIGVVDSHRYADTSDDPGVSANLSVAYDFETVKLFATGQYFRDMRHLGKVAVASDVAAAGVFGTSVAKDGWALNWGATAPMGSGKLYAAVGWMDAERSDDASLGMTRTTVSVGYDHNLSKRTVLYVGAGWMSDDYDDFGAAVASSGRRADNYGVTAGVSHRF